MDYIYNTSSQWNNSNKREVLRSNEIVRLPLISPEKDLEIMDKIVSLISEIENQPTKDLETELDELIFDLYGLLEFEKAIIREFYDINVHRKNDTAKKQDIESYFLKFKEVFELALSDDLAMKATYKISKNLGAYLCIRIVAKYADVSDTFASSNLDDETVFHVIKEQQLEHAFYSNKLNEIKTKVYETERFFLIKSNYFKDWTIRQAIKDANEEIRIFTQETAFEH